MISVADFFPETHKDYFSPHLAIDVFQNSEVLLLEPEHFFIPNNIHFLRFNSKVHLILIPRECYFGFIYSELGKQIISLLRPGIHFVECI